MKTQRWFWLLVVLIPISLSAQSKFEFWPGANYDPSIPSYAKVFGHEPGENILSSADLIKYLETLAQADILEFCVSRRYKEKQWPKDYWPASPVPPTRQAWNASIARFRKDRLAFQKLVTNPRRDLLAPVPAGTGQTLLREVILAADHTAYHVGEIVAVRRLLGHWPPA